MPNRTRIFIDFWNFQLNWNDRMAGKQCDWRALPLALVDETNGILKSAGGATEGVTLEETPCTRPWTLLGTQTSGTGWRIRSTDSRAVTSTFANGARKQRRSTVATATPRSALAQRVVSCTQSWLRRA
jgi:hypothetical protein